MAHVLTLASSEADFTASGVDRSRLGFARAAAHAWVESGETTGLVVAAARRGRVVLLDAFGVPRPDSDTPLTVDALFPIASITKPIVATGMMRLVEDGLVGLNRPVHEYVPEFTGAGREDVAVWHLLSHTSGLGATDELVRDSSLSGVEVIAAYIEAVCRLPIVAPPGSTFDYTGAGYELAAEIIRRVSGTSLEAFVQQQVLDPLDMSDTYLVVPEGASERIARRYARMAEEESGGYASEYEQEPYQRTPWAGSGAYSTAADLLAFGQTFLQGGTNGDARILSPASVRLMTTPQTGNLSLQFDDEIWPRASWGYGWHIHGATNGRRGPSLYSPSTFEHVGLGGSLLWVDPENELVGVCLSLLRQGSMGLYPAWQGDLLINAIMASLDG